MVRWIKVFVASAVLFLVVSVFATLVWFANDWIVSSLATMTVLAWLAGWLVVVYRRERVRATATGALIAGGVYWMLALGPWFNVNIGPTLLTSRLLAWISTQATPAGQQLAIYNSYSPMINTTGYQVQTSDYLVTASGVVTTSPQITWSYPIAQSVPVVSIAPPRHSAGQWCFTWLFALAGGGFAWLFAWRTAAAASTETRPATAPEAGP